MKMKGPHFSSKQRWHALRAREDVLWLPLYGGMREGSPITLKKKRNASAWQSAGEKQN